LVIVNSGISRPSMVRLRTVPEVWAPREGAEQGDEVFVGIRGNVRDPQVVALRRKVQGQVRFLRVP